MQKRFCDVCGKEMPLLQSLTQTLKDSAGRLLQVEFQARSVDTQTSADVCKSCVKQAIKDS